MWLVGRCQGRPPTKGWGAWILVKTFTDSFLPWYLILSIHLGSCSGPSASFQHTLLPTLHHQPEMLAIIDETPKRLFDKPLARQLAILPLHPILSLADKMACMYLYVDSLVLHYSCRLPTPFPRSKLHPVVCSKEEINQRQGYAQSREKVQQDKLEINPPPPQSRSYRARIAWLSPSLVLSRPASSSLASPDCPSCLKPSMTSASLSPSRLPRSTSIM